MDHLSLIRAWDQRARKALVQRHPGSIRALLGSIPPGASAELVAALQALLPVAEEIQNVDQAPPASEPQPPSGLAALAQLGKRRKP